MAIVPAGSDASAAKKFQLVGGDLCLDFTNTVGGKRGAVSRENLHTYSALLNWLQQAGVVDPVQAHRLAQQAGRDPAAAGAVLSRALELREVIYRIFAAVIEGRGPVAADLQRLNAELASGLGRLRVERGAEGFRWGWRAESTDLAAPLGPIARAAADLLTNPRALPCVRRCGGDNCGWLFIDSSKNHSRRWCDMRDCGNRAKVRRHRLKQRAG